MPNSTPAYSGVSRAVREIAPGYDIDKVYLFGSYARNDQHDDSDVDLCLETGPSFSLFSAGGFADDLERVLGRSVDIVTEDAVYAHVREGLIRDRVLLYER